MPSRTLIAAALTAITVGATACGGSGAFGEADVQGAIGDFNFGSDVSVYHNTGVRGEIEFAHIVVVDREIDCLDMDWTSNNYFFEPTEVAFEFGAVQFTWDSPPEAGATYSLDGDSAAEGWRIISQGVPANSTKAVDGETSEGGSISLTDISDESMSGSFEALFDIGNLQGSFTSVKCRNVR
ncbi:MAG: hypothetical protein AB8H79_11675 [Myxococcota bacterium]